MKTSLRHDEIPHVLKKGKRTVGNGITLVCESGNGKTGRYAVLIPKKKVKKSVERNKVRRMLREIMRMMQVPCQRYIIIYTGKSRSFHEIKLAVKQMAENIVY